MSHPDQGERRIRWLAKAISLGVAAWLPAACFGDSSPDVPDSGFAADGGPHDDAKSQGGDAASDGSGGGDANLHSGSQADARSGEASADLTADATLADAANGDGATTAKFKAVAVGSGATCALTVDGRAYCWGSTGAALGVSSVTQSAVPAAVETALRFDAIAVGPEVTCALTSDGSAYCWGFNSTGCLGDGTTTDHKTPVAVTGGLHFTSIAAANNSVCATTADGSVYCWGDNSLGVLGDGTTTARSAPTKVASTLAFSQVSTGGFHACAITTTGAAWCWGDNSVGALGDGTKNSSLVPVAVTGGLSFRAIVAAESSKTCGLTTDGSAYCWGMQAYGALGNGVDDPVLKDAIPKPVAVLGGSHYTGLAGSAFSSCAVTTAGGGECWGSNSNADLGDGTTTNRLMPGALATSQPLVAVAMTDYESDHGCALTTAGDVLCWGTNGGAVGDGTTTLRTAPVPIVAPTAP